MNTAVAEAAPAPTPTETTQVTPPNTDAESLAIFEQAKNEQPQQTQQQQPEPAPPKQPEKPAKEAAKAATDKPADEFPEELLTGKTPEKKPETEVEKAMDYEPPANLSEKAKANWKTLRAHADEVSKENATLKTQLEQLKTAAPKADPKTAEEVESFKKRVAELEAIVERKAFEESPRFKQFGAKEKVVIESAKKYLKGKELKPEIFEASLKLEGSERLAFLEEHGADPSLIAALGGYLTQIDLINGEKQMALDNHKELYKDYEQEERSKAERQQKAEMEQEHQEFSKHINELLPNLIAFKKIPGADKWNADADSRLEFAHKVFKGEASNGEIAEVILRGAGAAVVEKLYLKAVEKANSLQEQVRKLTATQPTIGSQQVPFTPSNDASRPWEESALANFERARASVGAQ